MWHAWGRRNAYKVSVEKPEVHVSFGGRRRRWKDNIKMGLKEMEGEGMD